VKYIEKDIQTLKTLDDKANFCFKKALGVFGLEFLDFQPLEMSGVAKAWDAEHANRFAFTIAKHICEYSLKIDIQHINEMRYGLVLDKQKLYSQCITFTTPRNYNISNAMMLQEELKAAKESSLNKTALKELEKRLVIKKFGETSQATQKVLDSIDLDPLYGYTLQEKISLKAANAVSAEDFALSISIASVIDSLYNKISNFKDLPLDKKKELAKAEALKLVPDIPAIQVMDSSS